MKLYTVQGTEQYHALPQNKFTELKVFLLQWCVPKCVSSRLEFEATWKTCMDYWSGLQVSKEQVILANKLYLNLDYDMEPRYLFYGDYNHMLYALFLCIGNNTL